MRSVPPIRRRRSRLLRWGKSRSVRPDDVIGQSPDAGSVINQPPTTSHRVCKPQRRAAPLSASFTLPASHTAFRHVPVICEPPSYTLTVFHSVDHAFKARRCANESFSAAFTAVVDLFGYLSIGLSPPAVPTACQYKTVCRGT